MEIYGDFHTHTKYSHGKGTVEENAISAENKGLKALAISDHGLKHVVFGLRRRKIEKLKKDISGLKDKFNVDILMGVEANITGLDGTVDLELSDYEMFDVILAGFHKIVYPDKPGDFFKFFLRNYFAGNDVPQKIIKQNTNAFIKAIKNNKIDVITHINYGARVNCKEVAKAAGDYGTFIEINSKRISYSDEEFMQMYDTDANFIINSDAHTSGRVGEFGLALDLVKRLNVSPERIANADRLPKFRSKTS